MIKSMDWVVPRPGCDPHLCPLTVDKCFICEVGIINSADIIGCCQGETHKETQRACSST